MDSPVRRSGVSSKNFEQFEYERTPNHVVRRFLLEKDSTLSDLPASMCIHFFGDLFHDLVYLFIGKRPLV